MANVKNCPKCGVPVAAGAVEGLCSACLLRGALNPHHSNPPESDEDWVEGGDFALPGGSRRFGDYELLAPIAHGGMGVVWRARQPRLNRVVALKMIRAGRFAGPDDVRRFLLEAEAAARLDHPNIVPIYEFGEHDGRHFFTMKFIEGGSLAARISNLKSQISNSQAAKLLAAVARAVHYAHARGVLHRDLKPANILLDVQGEPFVTDFGLAKLDVLPTGNLGAPGPAKVGTTNPLTLSGQVLGTPAYMAPEQAAGPARDLTIAADVYSLGAILYELLAGRPPFQADTPLATMKMVVEEPVPVEPLKRGAAQAAGAATLQRFHGSRSHDLITICLKCLEKNPQHRYPAALALAEDLERWQRGESILARPSSVWQHGLKWARRKPAWAALLGVIVLAVAAFVVTLVLHAGVLSRERNVSREQARLATNATARADANALLTRQNLYAADVARAGQALENSDHHLAWTALFAHAPADASTLNPQPSTDLRGFEWRWFWQRAQGNARKTFPAHWSKVNSIAYSPDGRFVVSAGADGVTQLWDAATEQMLRTVEQPEHPLTAYTDQLHEMPRGRDRHHAAFSPDSHTLLTCFLRELNLWEVASGRRLWNFQTTNSFNEVVFSPTDPNAALATPHPAYPVLGLLDAAQGRFTAVFTNGRADVVCFTPDGRRFARWDRSLRRIWLQDFPSGKIAASITVTSGPVEQMTFTSDGRTLVTCSLLQGPLELYDVESQQSAGQLVGHVRAAHALAVSPDGRWLASGGNDQTLRLWDLAARREVRQFSGHRGPVLAVAFSPDGRRLASGGHDGTVRFWDVEPPAPPPPLTNVFGVFAFSPDGRWLVTQNRKGTNTAMSTLWELPARRVARAWATPHFQSAVFTANGTLLTARTGSSNEPPSVRRWERRHLAGDSANKELAGRMPALPEGTTAETFFRGIPTPCTAIVLSPDGQFTVTGHTNGALALWETSSGRLIHQTGREFIASIGYREREIISAVNPLVFSADGRTLAAISFDWLAVKTWTLPGLRPLGGQVFIGNYEIPLALSPDGQRLALGGMHLGLDITLWDADLRQPETKLRGHQEFLKVVAWSPDGSTLASGGRDKRLKLWHLPTQREVATLLALPEEATFTSMTFSPDGAWLGAGDDLGHLHLFHAPPHARSDREPPSR